MQITQSNKHITNQSDTLLHNLNQLKDESWLVYFDPYLKGYVFAKKSNNQQPIPLLQKKGGEL